MRKKLKKFKNWIELGKFTKEQVMNAYYSWRGYASNCNSYATINKMDQFVVDIFNRIVLKNI